MKDKTGIRRALRKYRALEAGALRVGQIVEMSGGTKYMVMDTGAFQRIRPSGEKKEENK